MRKIIGDRQVKGKLLPAMFLFFFWPMVVHMELLENRLAEYPWFSSMTERGDFFLYWKGKVFLFLVLWMLIVMTDRILICGQWKILEKKFGLLFGYVILTVLSTIFSVDRIISLQGMNDLFENVWILLGYMVIVCYIYSVVEERRDVEAVLYAALAGVILQCLIGISQIAGKDFWQSDLGKWFIIPEKYDTLKIIFNFAAEEIHRVYMTFYNPNYAGVYILLMAPLPAILLVFSHNRIWRTAGILIEGLLYWCLIETGSKTCMILFLVLTIFGVLVLCRQKHIRWKNAVIGCMVGVVLVCGYNLMTEYKVSDYLKRTVLETEKEYKLEDILVKEKEIQVQFAGEMFHFALQDSGKSIKVWDNDNENVILKKEKEGSYTAAEYEGVTFLQMEQNGIDYVGIEYQGIKWYFTNYTETGGYTYITRYGKADKIKKAYSLFPKEWDTLFTFRGYIWGRTIPLLPQYLLWGSGPDTFAVVFQQNDYLTRAQLDKGFFEEVLVKPHNMYLQTALQTGVLSLICLLLFWWKYCWESWKLYVKRRVTDEIGLIGLGIYIGVVGYLLAGLLNDSMVVVAPFFWGMLGIGLAVNKMRKNVIMKK